MNLFDLSINLRAEDDGPWKGKVKFNLTPLAFLDTLDNSPVEKLLSDSISINIEDDITIGEEPKEIT